MGRASRQRRMPSTPRAGGPAGSSDDSPGDAAESTPRHAAPDAGRSRPETQRSGSSSAASNPAPADEPAYLVQGTGCVAGHERGRELGAGPIGPLPSARTTWIGVALLVWIFAGLYFLIDRSWFQLGILGLLLWLLSSAVVQRRRGHRGKCWRTRAWRHAWGGLVPGRN